MPHPVSRTDTATYSRPLRTELSTPTPMMYCNFNILVSYPPDKVTPVTSFLETKLYECGIMPSRTAYNQLELFI